ncbi:DUF6266 family protein [Pedobacter frigoris]|uniref:Uncharacterized protein n=1 Tax=Pedobacter frigoris TaxID=2571272 RepID=A0A4V5P1X3_9SPHI|nr:DUF6266 family protein [Pedobacter frigoris]TKC08892.1 hypothetical protein FA047_01995 [Pedobacter frigoris]
MGKLTGGPYYHLVGRTGNNVGRVVKGKNVFSMRPAKSNRPPSELQLNQRNKFAAVTRWMGSGISDFVALGFQDFDSEMTGFNAAVQYNLDHAVTGSAPNYVIDYPNAKLSRGKLSLPATPEVAAVAGQALEFTWGATIGSLNAKPGDLAVCIAYCDMLDTFVMSVGAVTRAALEYELDLPADFAGESVHCWLAFLSSNKKVASNSAYLGVVTVT